MSKKNIAAAIYKHRRFLISSHINPDGDAIGSELALSLALKQMGKEVVVCNRDQVPAAYGFLPAVEEIKLPHQVSNHFEVLVVLDCAHFDRIAAFTPADFRLVINIDHHATNYSFGDINWYRAQASSTAELVFELILALPVEVTPEIATCLYTGLLTDTGCFCYSNASAKSFRLAARLVKYGAQPAAIAKAVYEEMSLARMCLLGESLKTLQLHAKGAIASMLVTQQMFGDCKAVRADAEDLVNYPRAVQGVKAAIFLHELEPEFYKVSLRSKVQVDVARVAEKFGGGGHFHAAGCRVKGSLQVVRQQLIQELSKALDQFSTTQEER